MKYYETRLMLVMCVPTLPNERDADRADAELTRAGFKKDRPLTACYPCDEDDQPDDTGLFLMQELDEPTH